jgi:hypothetical protein
VKGRIGEETQAEEWKETDHEGHRCAVNGAEK